jgi:hypothetical protein
MLRNVGDLIILFSPPELVDEIRHIVVASSL